jgi:hypothetical protein
MRPRPTERSGASRIETVASLFVSSDRLSTLESHSRQSGTARVFLLWLGNNCISDFPASIADLTMRFAGIEREYSEGPVTLKQKSTLMYFETVVTGPINHIIITCITS